MNSRDIDQEVARRAARTVTGSIYEAPYQKPAPVKGPSRVELKAAKAALEAAGFKYRYTVMSDKPGQANGRYGLAFSPPGLGDMFYLNIETIGALPIKQEA